MKIEGIATAIEALRAHCFSREAQEYQDPHHSHCSISGGISAKRPLFYRVFKLHLVFTYKLTHNTIPNGGASQVHTINTPSTTDTHGGSPADAPAYGRGLAVGMMDRRTKEWRRRRELIDMFTSAIGNTNVTAMLADKIEVAAELAVIAEMTRASFMAGAGAVADDVVRTSNQAARAERALGIGARQAPAKPNLHAYLAGKAA